MREIKFRAWDDQNKLMIYLDNKDNVLVFDMDGWRIGEADYDWGVIGSQARSETNGHLMQYTGLKDRKGNKIYEGDIVKCHDHPTGVDDGVGHVFFNWGYYSVSGRQSPLHDFGTAWTEVLGNIYENPELVSSYEIQI